MEYIFAIDSKNRVLAMFMGIVALFAGLNIANGANIKIVYAIWDSLKFWDIFLVVLIISLTIFLSAYMFRFILVMLMSFLDFLFDNSSDMSKISKRKKQIFIAELVKHHELPKKKHKVYFEI